LSESISFSMKQIASGISTRL